jgi:hypothetical protein
MINIHLNGDIVRYPNVQEIHKERAKDLDGRGFCRYGMREAYCQDFQKFTLSLNKEDNFSFQDSRCKLGGCILCTKHRERVQLGKQDKNFEINQVTYRKMASSAHYMIKESTTKILFLTLTFPPFKDSKYENYLLLTESDKKTFENEINQAFSRFVENLRTNYNCNGYIGVREFGKNTNRVHFHIMCAIPFIPFRMLNNSWCSAISNLCEYSSCAVFSNPKTRFIKTPIRAIKYVCKYFSKCRGQRSGTRLVFISNNILQPAKHMNAPLESVLDSFNFDYMKQTSDFTTCYRITDNSEFTNFCDKFLYPFFELSIKKPKLLHSYP